MVSCIGILGKVGQASCALATNQQINAVVPGSDAHASFLYWACSKLEPQLRREAGLQVIPIVNKTCFSRLQVPLPRFDEQERIVNALSRIERQIKTQVSHLGKYRLVKQGLMQDLLTGRVRVPEEAVEGVTA